MDNLILDFSFLFIVYEMCTRSELRFFELQPFELLPK